MSTQTKLYRSIIGSLQENILSGRYKPGDRLPTERELVEQFGVSRLTVREAIIGMEILGLVEARRGAGVFVTEKTPQTGDNSELDVGPFELTEARTVIEGECAALAAVNSSDELVAKLEGYVDRMAASDGGDRPSGWQADRSFHEAIADATGNGVLAGMVRRLWEMRMHSQLCLEVLERARIAGEQMPVNDHRVIIDAIAARDPAAARQAMREHLGRVMSQLITMTELEELQLVHDRAVAKHNDVRNRLSYDRKR